MSATAVKTGPKISLAAFYNAAMGQRGFQLAPHHYAICDGLEDRRIDKFMIIAPPGVGKSTILGVAYPIWQLGEDPSLTILGLSGGEKLIQTFMHAAMELIEHSPEFIELYGDKVRPNKKAGWSTDRGFFVTGRPLGDQDASYFACGMKSKALTGVHARQIIMDDIHDKENSGSPELRAAVKDTYYDTVLGRADPRGCRFVMAGRRWATDDLYGDQLESGSWVTLHLPAQRAGSQRLWYDAYVPKDPVTGEAIACCFSETGQKTKDQNNKRVVKYRIYYGIDPTGVGFYAPGWTGKRDECFTVKLLKPNVFETTYQGNPKAGDEDIFVAGDFRPFVPPGNLALGLQDPDVNAFTRQRGAKVVQAWDTASGKNAAAAYTAALTGLLVPCDQWHRGEDPKLHGKCDFHYDVHLLWMTRKKWHFGELALNLRIENDRWRPRPVLIEDKQSGIGLIQTFKGTDIPIKSIKVQEGKVERAVNGVGGGAGSVQGWCRLGRVWYADGQPWNEDWLDEMFAFSGDKSARSDQVDATVHLVAHAINLSAKRALMPEESMASTSEMSVVAQQRGDTAQEMERQARERPVEDSPWYGLCGTCVSYTIANTEFCRYWHRQTAGIQSCDKWSASHRAED